MCGGGGEMAVETGKRYRCPSCGAEFIVTRGSSEGELRCGEEPLEQIEGRGGERTMAVQLGKRYQDESTGIEVLCIKPGECDLNVDGRGMEELQPKVLPSAD
jgi:hypothetical protein